MTRPRPRLALFDLTGLSCYAFLQIDNSSVNGEEMPRKKLFKKRYIFIALAIVLAVTYAILVDHFETIALERLQKEVNKRTEGMMSISDLNLYPIRGKVAIDGILLRDPNGGDLPLVECRRATARLNIIKTLSSGEISINTVRIKDATIRIARDSSGKVNLPGLTALAFVMGKQAENANNKTASPNKTAVKVDQLHLNGTVIFSDDAISPDDPVELEVVTTVTLTHLSLLKDGRISTDFALTGRAGEELDLSLSGNTVIDPALLGPDTSLSGKISAVPLQYISPLKDQGIDFGSAKANVAVEINEGVISPTESHIAFTLSDVTYSGDAAIKIPRAIRSMPSIGLRVPLQGTVDSPEIALEDAIRAKLLQMISGSDEMTDAARRFISE